jgi:hypothetical protein
MAYSSIKRIGSLTIDDYLDVLPHSNQIKKLTNNSYLTNCVGKNHEDKNPSMALSQGDKYVVYKCFAECPQEELTSYFNEKLKHKTQHYNSQPNMDFFRVGKYKTARCE